MRWICWVSQEQAHSPKRCLRPQIAPNALTRFWTVYGLSRSVLAATVGLVCFPLLRFGACQEVPGDGMDDAVAIRTFVRGNLKED